MRRTSHARRAALLAVACLGCSWVLAGPTSAASPADTGRTAPAAASTVGTRPADVAVVPPRTDRVTVADAGRSRARSGTDAPWSGIPPAALALAALLAVALGLRVAPRRSTAVVGADAAPRGPPVFLPV